VGNFDKDEWELYKLNEDRAQTRNVAAEHPEVLEELKALWTEQAKLLRGFRLDDRMALEIIMSPRPQPSEPRDRYVYYPRLADVPKSVAVNIRRRSYTIAAGLTVDTPDAAGVLFANGGAGGGHCLFVKDRRLHYVYNWLGEKVQSVSADRDVPTGKHVLTAEFQKTGGDEQTRSAMGTLTLYVDEEPVGKGEIMTQPGFFALSGDGLSVGRDGASPVSRAYAAPFAFTGGTIDRVVVDVSGDHYVDHEKEILAYLARD
jgi:arylsulfatase